METGFTPDELMLNYTEWSALVNERMAHLAPNVRQWLGQWQIWDFACSPMDDNERRHIRYGHYLGWWHRENVSPNAGGNGPRQTPLAEGDALRNMTEAAPVKQKIYDRNNPARLRRPDESVQDYRKAMGWPI